MGLPFAALLIKPEHDIWKPAEHNGTFRGNTHAFVTARVALEKFWKDDTFQKEINAKAEMLRETALKRIAEIVPGARLKGRGMMRGVDVGIRRSGREDLRAGLREGSGHRDLGRR